MAWRATSLGPKPSLCLFLCFVYFFIISFPFFAFNKNLFFPPRKGLFCLLLSVPPCFSLAAFFGLPFFQFLFLCLSLSLSCPFLSFFLLVFLFALFWFLVFVSFLVFFVFFAFVSWKEQHQKIQFLIVFHQSFLIFWFPVLFSHWNPFFLSLLFLIFSYVFCSTSMLLVSWNTSWKTPIFGQKGGCNKAFSFITRVL